MQHDNSQPLLYLPHTYMTVLLYYNIPEPCATNNHNKRATQQQRRVEGSALPCCDINLYKSLYGFKHI